MAADETVVRSLSDTKVSLNGTFTEVLWVQVHDIKTQWDDLIEALVIIECYCSPEVLDRFHATFDGEGRQIVRHATFMAIFHFENCSVHNDVWPETIESSFWNAKVLSIIDRFFTAP